MMLSEADKKEALPAIRRSKGAREIYRANALKLRSKVMTISEVADMEVG